MTGVVDIRVRYAETDQMGRVHHRHFLVWAELGRTALMRAHGVSYAELEKQGVMLPVARVEVEYRGAAFYDELVRVETRVERVRSREIVFEYRFTRPEDGTRLARAWTTLISTDATGTPARMPEVVREALGRLAASTEET